jgi:hypothetical protein
MNPQSFNTLNDKSSSFESYFYNNLLQKVKKNQKKNFFF